jgi:site-specific DNA-adenine methylase
MVNLTNEELIDLLLQISDSVKSLNDEKTLFKNKYCELKSKTNANYNTNKRTIITRSVLEVIANLMDKQDQKGLTKYGKTLDKVNLDDYDWNQMAMEEMADCIKYLMMENFRLKRIISVAKGDLNNG